MLLQEIRSVAFRSTPPPPGGDASMRARSPKPDVKITAGHLPSEARIRSILGVELACLVLRLFSSPLVVIHLHQENEEPVRNFLLGLVSLAQSHPTLSCITA